MKSQYDFEHEYMCVCVFCMCALYDCELIYISFPGVVCGVCVCVFRHIINKVIVACEIFKNKKNCVCE